GVGDVVDVRGGALAGVVGAVVERERDGVVTGPVGVGVALRGDRAGRVDVEAGGEGAVTPVDRDVPGAVVTRVAEGAKREVVRGALVRALVGRRGHARGDVVHRHRGRVFAE